MGCGLSFKSEKPKKKQKEVTSNTCTILSDRQNLLIRETWSIIQDEILTIGVYIYYSKRLWPIIDDSFRQVLCDVYTTEVREAWQTFIEFIFESMKEGIDAMSLAQSLSTECEINIINNQSNDKPILNRLEENSDAELTISDENVDTKLLNK
uniref:Uncharacterized protein n=1 Tax=Octopus bimaculoides TaxID=37653 RepID=A0A0L8G4T2_OCTBM